ncbi:MAG TPA: metallophosphoesterase [Anaerolineae bacterium]|jgi:UDP-2,3-diacylglucosamine pyrophosphatase LpxH|nr:metallophosphoesterase [Anaerolineae bacterium]
MPLDRVQTREQLGELWQDKSVGVLEAKGQKYAIISDLHMGDGGDADDFYKNEPALLNALEHYRTNGYTLILLGDVEELWQFDLEKIVDRYKNTVYAKIQSFGDRRVHRIYGNHDFEWGGFEDPAKVVSKKSKLAEEALRMKDVNGKEAILLVHGHQGSIDSDKFSWFSRFFVRLYKPVEPLVRLTGLLGHGAATKSAVAHDYERTYYSWAKKNKVIVICGHSHRAIFASKSYADKLLDDIAALRAKNSMRGTRLTTKLKNLREIDRLEREWKDERDKGRMVEIGEATEDPLPCYFNSGCGLFDDGITNLEINGDQIRLVKWHRQPEDGKKYVEFSKGKLSEFVKKTTA